MSLTTIVDTHTTDGSIVAPTEQVDRALQAIVAKTKRTSKKQKDPNAPKRPMGTYMLWLADNRRHILEEHCAELQGREMVTAVTRKAGEIWKTLTDEQKSPYVQKADTLRAEYQAKMKDYTPDPQFQTTKSKNTKGPKYDPEEIPQPTEGWTGPFERKFLKNKVVGIDGKKIRILKNFVEAVQKAQDINAAWDSAKEHDDFPAFWSKHSKPCAGITKTKTGYDLRLGADLLTTEQKHLSTGIASWIFGEYQPPVPTNTETDTDADFQAKTNSPETEAEPTHEAEPTLVNKPEPKKPKKIVRKKMKPTSKYPVAELEDIEIEKDGEDVALFLHENSGDVFDKDNLLEPVGKVDGDGELVFF